ncbi:MAG TPA: ankyrin repeat domain-containing protein [Gammaproteobacteria bacterium]|nr:ankyrin repeat domain-containing protein [Gammaproteobacteria bacterium]
MFEQDAWGRNQLHWAALNGDLDDVKDLVGRGMSMHVEDNDGLSAFRLAIRGNNRPVVDFLLSRGARVTPECIQDAEKKKFFELVDHLRLVLTVQLTEPYPVFLVPQPHRVAVVRGVFDESQILAAQPVYRK